MIGLLVFICKKIRAYYSNFAYLLKSLPVDIPPRAEIAVPEVTLDRSLHTAVLFVSGAANTALHSIAQTVKLFGKNIDHFVFIEIGVIDAGTFKGYDASFSQHEVLTG